MAYSEAQKKATAKYMKKNLDEIKLRVPKGQKQVIKDIAKGQGDSLNGYIKKAVRTQIKADTGDTIDL